MSDSIALFTRLGSTHKPECPMSLEGPLPGPVADPTVLADTLGSDGVAAYAAACHPIYEHLRRIIGQIAGLTILARLTARREINDLPELKQCETRWREAKDALGVLSAPNGVAPHKVQLESALVFCGRAMRAYSDIGGQTDMEAALDQAGLQIKRAYAHLEAASSQRAGLHMVDFTHSCCCSGH